MNLPAPITGRTIRDALLDARRTTLALCDDLSDAQLQVPHLDIVNPLIWEIGHVAWFQENWILRHLGKVPDACADTDELYDSMAVAHPSRWDLVLPTRAKVLDYLARILDCILERLPDGPLDADDAYFYRLVLFHEDMHAEAMAYTRQTLGYAAPSWVDWPQPAPPAPGGDVAIPGGRFRLGAEPDAPFAFDNEKWAHDVDVEPFSIARRVVTKGEFADFARDGGYRDRRHWSDHGWAWREAHAREMPVYWSPDGAGDYTERRFDTTHPLDAHAPMMHLTWFEADAYCRWAGRRLPTEVEWELAAAATPERDGFSATKRTYPWGETAPDPSTAALDFRPLTDANALADGDSAFGLRQMLGTVWEWTATTFEPYPGFVADPYKDYSEPWFHTRRVLRGGSWATRGRMMRNTWRNYFTPDRYDVFAGFRTCSD